jgi:hypothetical protein
MKSIHRGILLILPFALIILAGCSDNEADVTIRCVGDPILGCVDYRCSAIGPDESGTWTIKWDRKTIFSRGRTDVFLYAEDVDFPEYNFEGFWVTLEHGDHHHWDIGWVKKSSNETSGAVSGYSSGNKISIE